MNLLDLMIKVGLKDEASGKVEGVASKVVGTLGKAGATAAKAIGVGVAAVGAGVAAVTGMSMNAYAAYEQNVGGIQKIFGNMGKSLEDYAAMTGQSVEQCSGKWQQLEQAQTTVLANADAAYKTAGLSANRYMEQVTGFSAALVSSLGGDTVKAAKYANTAMVDMSDNANTFGTAMEDLQNAYQGFAKQNYTMLDNLKLGYGGTKEEMQHLIKDAHAVNSAVDESSLSFDNIVLAIHTMQEQMQIAGTTSREAATTIEGSCNMAKAAWENWVTELGKDDADMQAHRGAVTVGRYGGIERRPARCDHRRHGAVAATESCHVRGSCARPGVRQHLHAGTRQCGGSRARTHGRHPLRRVGRRGRDRRALQGPWRDLVGW